MGTEETETEKEERKSERFRNSKTAQRMNKDIDDLVQARMKNIMPELSISLTKVMWVMVFAMLILWNSINDLENTDKRLIDVIHKAVDLRDKRFVEAIDNATKAKDARIDK